MKKDLTKTLEDNARTNPSMYFYEKVLNKIKEFNEVPNPEDPTKTISNVEWKLDNILATNGENITTDQFELLGCISYLVGLDFTQQIKPNRIVFENIRKRFEQAKIGEFIDSFIPAVCAVDEKKIKKAKDILLDKIKGNVVYKASDELKFQKIFTDWRNVISNSIIDIKIAPSLQEIIKKQIKTITYDDINKMNAVINQNNYVQINGKGIKHYLALYQNELFRNILTTAVEYFEYQKMVVIYLDSILSVKEYLNRKNVPTIFDGLTLDLNKFDEYSKTFEDEYIHAPEVDDDIHVLDVDSENDTFEEKKYRKKLIADWYRLSEDQRKEILQNVFGKDTDLVTDTGEDIAEFIESSCTDEVKIKFTDQVYAILNQSVFDVDTFDREYHGCESNSVISLVNKIVYEDGDSDYVKTISEGYAKLSLEDRIKITRLITNSVFENSDDEQEDLKEPETRNDDDEVEIYQQLKPEEFKKLTEENPFRTIFEAICEALGYYAKTVEDLQEGIKKLYDDSEGLKNFYAYLRQSADRIKPEMYNLESISKEDFLKFVDLFNTEHKEILTEYKELGTKTYADIEPDLIDKINNLLRNTIEDLVLTNTEAKKVLIQQYYENSVKTYFNLQEIVGVIETCFISGKSLINYTILKDYLESQTQIKQVFEISDKMQKIESRVAFNSAILDIFNKIR